MPGCALASDQHYRETDLAIDFREDVPPLPRAAVDRIVALMQAEGMTAKVSSIHVNGWFGAYDKLTMTRTLLAEAFGIDLDAERERFVFVGDSPNDAPMFAFFPNAVGVANVREFADRIATLPAYVTQAEAGRGVRRARGFPAGVAAAHEARRHGVVRPRQARCRASRALRGRRSAPSRPDASSMRSASFHFAMRSERANEPTLSWPAFQPTARWTIETSSVSPERADTIVREARAPCPAVERGARLGERAGLVRLDQHGVAGAVGGGLPRRASALVVR